MFLAFSKTDQIFESSLFLSFILSLYLLEKKYIHSDIIDSTNPGKHIMPITEIIIGDHFKHLVELFTNDLKLISHPRSKQETNKKLICSKI